MASEDALSLLRENNELLRQMYACLARIEIAITARTIPKPKSRSKRMADYRREFGQAAVPDTVCKLWAEMCPDCPQPVSMDGRRRAAATKFWERLGGEEGVRDVFTVINSNDWLSGRQIRERGRTYARKPAGVGLFEAINNVAEIVEGTYR